MDNKKIPDLILKAQQGNDSAREELLHSFKPFISKVASEQCGRFLDWRNDDELSVALLAFNQAIDNFAAEKSTNFTSFAALIIRHRLIDYFRKEEKHRHLLLSQVTEEGQFFPGEREEAEKAYQAKTLQENRQEELLTFTAILAEYGISLEDLTKSSPKHQDTKLNLAEIAKTLINNQQLLTKLTTTKQLPIKELMSLTGVSRKVLETGRRYIIALIIIFSYNLYHLQSFVQLPDLKNNISKKERGGQRWLS